MKLTDCSIGLPFTAVAAALTLSSLAGEARSQAAEPMIRSDAVEQIAEHVYVILDRNVSLVPNVGIVVGDRATLIVDTGLGDANGRTVLEAARSVSDNEVFYLTATHFHPEHDLGARAFPDAAIMVRWSGQQDEVDTQGAAMIERFSGFSPVVAGLLDGADYRPPDILFAAAVTIDLGGVRVVASGVGPNHTLGDTVFFVESDRVLFTGDVVMSVFPAVSGPAGDIDRWLANLAGFMRLDPVTVVPAHGRTGDAGLIQRYQDYFESVRERVLARKRAGDSPEQISAALVPVLARDFAELAPPQGDPSGRIAAAIQAAYRLE